jgi:hypothetical protein
MAAYKKKAPIKKGKRPSLGSGMAEGAAKNIESAYRKRKRALCAAGGGKFKNGKCVY